MSAAKQIEERAALWLLRRQAPGWSTSDERELDAWLAQSPLHEVTWLRLEYGWRKVDRLAALRSPTTAVEAPHLWSRPAHKSLMLGMAVVVLLTLSFLTGSHTASGSRYYETVVGGHQSALLPDGSRIELNTDTRLRAKVDDTERTVWLERGEVFFDIARVTGKPFVVHAGPRRITVLGTEFAIRRDGGQVRVAVTEGRVQVDQPSTGVGSPPLIVTPGEIVRAEGRSNLLQSRSLEKVSRQLSWRQGALVFDETTIAQAVEELNRYNRRKLVVMDQEVATTRIGGSFEATNVDGFARLLRNAFGFTTVEEDAIIRISR